jgi:hypothetical protein
MAPTTPPKNTQRSEHDTIKRAHFFDAFDSKENATSVGEIARLPQINIAPSTARTWLKKREILGDQAIRRTRKTSSRLGRKPKVSASDLQYLTNQDDPIHEEPYKIQASTLATKPAARTLQRHAAQDGARRFKKPYTTEISQKNKSLRVDYGTDHDKETLTGFWQYVWFTDEVHLQSAKLQNKAEYELRYPGQEKHLKETKSSGLDVIVHCAAGISYNHKGQLIFYKDPKEPTEKAYRPRKPRKTMYQSEEQYQKQVKA